MLLILASVSITVVFGDNGILTQAKKAEDLTLIASEKEYLEQNILAVQIGNYSTNINSKKLGEALNTRRLDNSSNWHIIKVNDKTYDIGWNYIEKETELPNYGKAQNSWLINYETGEMIQLEENNYMSLSAGDMLAVKDNLIINIDSSIIDESVENKEQALEKQLGENVDLVNFNYDDNSGLTSTSFNFDGEDDYIKVQYDREDQKEALAKNGFTFEFYGIWDGGTTDPRVGWGYNGIFSYWDGNESNQAKFRFGIGQKAFEGIKSCIIWNAGTGEEAPSDFSENYHSVWNIYYVVDLNKLKEGCYITITVDTSNAYTVEGKDGEYYKQTVYLDGEKLYSGDYNKKQWDNFVKNDLPTLKYFCIGRSTMTEAGAWNYSKMNAYCLRLYSRALSEEEVMKNYEKSVEYHSLQENK